MPKGGLDYLDAVGFRKYWPLLRTPARRPDGCGARGQPLPALPGPPEHGKKLVLVEREWSLWHVLQGIDRDRLAQFWGAAVGIREFPPSFFGSGGKLGGCEVLSRSGRCPPPHLHACPVQHGGLGVRPGRTAPGARRKSTAARFGD